ncbi:MAG: hypothetical protein KDK37_08725 [Leptospiraceae bacterium]|nr:hypothetical protein [Leptospiraceae bacterium]MCB1304348.1 hypothetical protein [Leptospiraceae bacterium]
MARFGTIIVLITGMVFLGQCKKDSNTTTEELAQYLVLCPSGIDSCYNDCATATGYPGSDGATYRQFTTCTATCDSKCSTSALLFSL